MTKTRGNNDASARRRRGARLRSDDGAGIAEFALVAPLLLILLFGIVEFGIAFNRAQAVEAAAREGGRLASISSTTNLAQVQTRVDDTLFGIPLQNPATAGWNASCVGREGDPVTVTVTTDHDVIIPLLGSPLPTITLTGQAVFRCEA